MEQRPEKKRKITRKQYFILAFCCLGFCIFGTLVALVLAWTILAEYGSHPLFNLWHILNCWFGVGFWWFVSLAIRETKPGVAQKIRKFLTLFCVILGFATVAIPVVRFLP